MAAPRGARGAVAGHATTAVRDRGPGLVLPALPHAAAAGDSRPRLPGPLVLAAGRPARHRRGPGPLRRGPRRRGRRGVLPGPVRPLPRRGGERAAGRRGGDRRPGRRRPGRHPGAGPEAVRRGPDGRGGRWPNDPYAPGEERYRVLRSLLHGDRTAGSVVESLQEAGLRGMGGAGFPDRAQVGAGRGAAGGPEVRHLQRRRVRARDVQGPPDPGGAAPPRARGAAARAWSSWAPRRAGSSSATSTAPRRPCCARRSRSCAGRAWSARTSTAAGGDWPWSVFTSPGGYILGEESALIECMEGHRGEPRNKPPFPGTYGLWGRPTLMNSVETLADVPVIVERGARLVEGPGRRRLHRPEVLRRLRARRPARGLLRADGHHGRRPAGGGRRDGRRRRPRRGAAGRRLVELPRPRPPRRAPRLRDPGGGRVHARVRRHGGDGRGHRPAGRRDERPRVLRATSRAASASPAGSGPPRRTPCSGRCWPAGGALDEGRRAELLELETVLRRTSICGLGQVALGPVVSVLGHDRGGAAARPQPRN